MVHTVCVVFRSALLIQNEDKLFASNSHNLWTWAIILEIAIGYPSLVITGVLALCESKMCDRIAHALTFLTAVLDTILQARIFYILYFTDLCKSAKMGDNWARDDLDSQLIASLILILLSNIYYCVMLCRMWNTTMDKDERCCACICIPTTLFISGVNIYISLYYECKVL